MIFLLYVRHFYIMTCPDIYEIAKHAFPKLYLNMKMSVFEAKKENILAGFISKHDGIHIS